MRACHRNNSEYRRRAVRPRHCAFTLIETTIAIVIVGGLLISVLRVAGSIARGRVVLINSQEGNHLASLMMSEILQAHYMDPTTDPPAFGLETGELNGSDRSAYDDVDDYDGWMSSPPVSRDGTPIPGYSGWSRLVFIKFTDPSNPNSNSQTDTGLVRIEVLVEDPLGRKTRLICLRAANSVYDTPPGQDTDLVMQVETTIQMTADSPALRAGINVLNQVLAGN